MAKIRIKGDTSGYIDIATPDVAGTTTLNLPTSNGDIVTTAGAVFTGDVTVDTNTFHVDTTNNRVGIGTSSPGAELEIEGATPEIRIDSTSSSARNYKIHSDGNELYIEGIGSSGAVKFG